MEGQYRKPRADLYTALLFLALVAIICGAVALYLEMGMYNHELRGAPAAVMAPAGSHATMQLVAQPHLGLMG